MNTAYKLLLTEGHFIVRTGLRVLLSGEPDLHVVGETDNGQDTLRMVEAFAPDLVIMDFNTLSGNGSDTIAEIKRSKPDVRILVLIQHKTEDSIRAALRVGADGYLLKEANDAELITAVRCVLSGQAYLSPGMSDKVINVFVGGSNDPATSSELAALTNREREVLKLVAEGRTNKFIAAQLNLSIKTVDKHRSNMMRKLDLHNASALTTFAIGHGLVTPG